MATRTNILALLLISCSGAPAPRTTPTPHPFAPDEVPEPVPTPEARSIDPRLDGLTSNHDATKLPSVTAAPADAPSGAIVTLVGGVIDGQVPADSKAILLWAEEDQPVATLLPMLAAAPADVEVYLAYGQRDGSPPVAWMRVPALEQLRCTAWLGATAATIENLAGATADAGAESLDDLLGDAHLCGTSWQSRLGGLQTGGASLYVRLPGGTCSKLDFQSSGPLVRAGAAPDVPALAFDYSQPDDDHVEFDGPTGAAGGKAAVVRCKMPFHVTGEDATSIAIERSYLWGMTQRRWTGNLFYAEAPCLAATEPRDDAPSCLLSLLASTSTLPDAVADRVASIAKRGGKLYDQAARCKAVKLGRDFHYDGISMRQEYVPQGDDFDTDSPTTDIRPVVQTTGDYVLVKGDRWYLSQKACRAGG